MNLSTIIHTLFSKGIKIKFSRIFSLLLIYLLATINTQAADITHDINGGALTIPRSSTDNYIVTGTGAVTANNILIQAGYKGTLTLKNVNIERSSGTSCITVTGQNNLSNATPITIVNIVLDGTNNLKYTGLQHCGLQVDQGAQINISAIDPTNNASGILYSKSINREMPGPGAAETINNGGAGIGAPTNVSQGSSTIYASDGSIYSPSENTAGGNIIISSGTITAWGSHGAGIGGGFSTYYNGLIIIYGGIIDSRAGRHAAGIGSGCPTGLGVVQYFADMSTVVALPPAEITCYGADTDGNQLAIIGLTGTRRITYINDPNKPVITVRTIDDEPDASIYLDLTETPDLESIFQTAGINSIAELGYDLKKVRVGRTNASGIMTFHGRFEQNTTFFTDASSSNLSNFGRPYLPVKKTVLNEETITLPLLDMGISLMDYPSIPLDQGYSAAQAKQNAYRLKIEYNDSSPMTNVDFSLQGGGANFTGMIFYASDNTTEISAPTTLNQGDVYYLQVPIVQDKEIGIYDDVLLINGTWKSEALQAPIRKIVDQRVIYDDTNTNTYIKMTASEDKFTVVHPTTKTITLNLNIDHSGLTIPYDSLDVTAKYLITAEANYDAALAATPLNTWTNMEIPATQNTNIATTVFFSGKPAGTYYIHWYVGSGIVYGHSKNVSDPPLTNGGYGPYKIVEQLLVGTITATSPYVCFGKVPAKITGTLPTGGSGDFSYQWQTSTNNSTWTNIAGANTQDYTPTAALSVSPTYFRREDTDNQLGMSIPTASGKIEEVSLPITLYWKTNAVDNNWNNPNNWVDKDGYQLGMVPLACTDVRITGGSDNYPSLDLASTPVDLYGNPQCRNITLQSGAELLYQHRLQYDKASVQYNFGYYGNTQDVTPGQQPENSLYPVANKRDVWYALAAPLKKMASGDFSLAGYPFIWQGNFQTSEPEAGQIQAGDFSMTFASNDIDLTSTTGAIALKVAGYDSKTGYSNHQNLENLKGVIEIPYFENTQIAEHFKAHTYDSITEQSSFYYFNSQTLQIIYNPIGRMTRGKDAYRFIYETDTNGTESIMGVPGYRQRIVRTDDGSQRVMVGNPLMASLNPEAFFTMNSEVLNEAAGFELLSEDHTWTQYGYDSANSIPSGQAFVITLKEGLDEVDLEYLFEDNDLVSNNVKLKSDIQQNASVYLSISQPGQDSIKRYAILKSSQEAYRNEKNVRKMIFPEGNSAMEAFFITSDGKEFNLIQYLDKNDHEISIGVKGADLENAYTLNFENISAFAIENNIQAVLYDKLLNIEQDLLQNSRYSFRQNQSGLNTQSADVNRIKLRIKSVSAVEGVTGNIQILYKQGQLVVSSVLDMDNVKVFDLQGRVIHNSNYIGTTYYSKDLTLSKGAYIVKVQGVNGSIEVEKIMQ